MNLTRDVCHSHMPGSIRTKVAKEAKATINGAEVQAKNCEASKNMHVAHV